MGVSVLRAAPSQAASHRRLTVFRIYMRPMSVPWTSAYVNAKQGWASVAGNAFSRLHASRMSRREGDTTNLMQVPISLRCLPFFQLASQL